MLQLSDVTLKRGEKELFEGLSLTIHGGQHVAIVGRNGCGKSTLFELIRYRLLPEDGDVTRPRSWRMAFMAQELQGEDCKALDWVLGGDTDYVRLRAALDKAEAEAANDPEQAQKLGTLHADFDAIDGYTAPARAGSILHGLGFTGEDFEQPVESFSGGWRIRLNLARTLMCQAELMLLDEPTNHLDVDATLWLERWLQRYTGTLLIISHDREFLDRSANYVAHIHDRRCTTYNGNYTSFERQRADNMRRAAISYAAQQKRIADIEQFVNRFKAKASKAKQAQSRMKELDRLTLAAPAYMDAPYDFQFPSADKMATPLLSIHEGQAGYGETVVLKNVELRVYPGSRIGLLGRNGAGKSTLIKAIGGELKLQSGERLAGNDCRIGYFAQHTVDQLQPNDSAMSHMQKLEENKPGAKSEQALRNYLGGWGFSGDAALQPAGTLSGGEKARLSLALIAWQKPALLLLDEPTNHLDIDMRHALIVALQQFAGAIIIVSHDRHLLRNCVDEFILVADTAATTYTDTLDDYAAWLLKKEQQDQSPDNSATTTTAVVDKKAERQQKAALRAQTQSLRNEIKTLERRIEKASEELQQIETDLADPSLYEAAKKEDLLRKTTRQGALRSQLSDDENQWLTLSETLEEQAGSL